MLHLLYARFWHKVLYDIGAVNTDEPFQRLVNQGMILGEGGVKMSKSLGNVINPEEVIREFGADAMRMYEMFMGPLEVSKPWSTQGIAGVKRFLDRVWRLSELPAADGKPPAELERLLHRTIKKVGEDTRTLQFNTAIAQMMIYVTELNKQEKLHPALWKPFVLLLSPYAPHLAEELWEKLGGKPSVTFQAYPQYSEELTREGTREIVFQINGKVRARLELAAGLSAAELEKQALAHPRIQELLAGQKPVKVIAVPDKLVNLVVPADAEGSPSAGRPARAGSGWPPGLREQGLEAAVLADFEGLRSASLRYFTGHPMDALFLLDASGQALLVPWDVSLAERRARVERIEPYTRFGRSLPRAIRELLSEPGLGRPVGATPAPAWSCPAPCPSRWCANWSRTCPGCGWSAGTAEGWRISPPACARSRMRGSWRRCGRPAA